MIRKIDSQISSVPRPLVEELSEEQTINLTMPTDQRVTPTDNFYIDVYYYLDQDSFVDVTYRLLKKDGSISSGILATISLPNNTAGQLKTNIVTPALEGSLISIAAIFRGSTINKHGVCFVQVGLFAGTNASQGTRLSILIAGYLTEGRGLCWPGHKAIKPLSGHGQQRFLGSFNGALPFYLTPPTNVRWQNLILYASVTTSAVAANRYLNIELETDAGTRVGRFTSMVAQTASTTLYYTFKDVAGSTQLPTNGTSVDVNLPCSLMTPLGGRFVVDILNKDAGDVIGWVKVYGEELIGY
jgi:hypothetical protein